MKNIHKILFQLDFEFGDLETECLGSDSCSATPSSLFAASRWTSLALSIHCGVL